MSGNYPVNTSFSQNLEKNLLMNQIVFIYLFIGAGERKRFTLFIKIKTNKNFIIVFWKVVNWMMFKFKLIGNFSLCSVWIGF